ncbi:MAG: hypothetical protein K0R17_3616 [Rariglobus sp.]|jgi:hypothetical protein|nr:hypothetical protein [Rariglobus sp.]
MKTARAVEAAREIADDLDAVALQVCDLIEDAKLHHLHRAEERLNRLYNCATSTAHGLRIQATKIESNL